MEQAESVEGKHIIVTGASSGIGLETVRALALAGAHVTMAVRNLEKTEPLRADIQKAMKEPSRLDVRLLDLSSLASVKAFAADYRADHTHLDILINNAGVMIPVGETRTKGLQFDPKM